MNFPFSQPPDPGAPYAALRRAGEPMTTDDTMNQPPPQSALGPLDGAYVRAANALHEWKDAAGFVPGARVRTRGSYVMPQNGTIAPYGNLWLGVDARSVLVRLDSGRHQPWALTNLALIEDNNQPTTP